MRLIDLITFAQIYNDLDIDTQLKLDAVLRQEEIEVDEITFSLLRNWLLETSRTFKDQDLYIDIATAVELLKLYHER